MFTGKDLIEFIILFLGASLLVAINAVKKGAAAEGLKVWDYIWRGHDPTSVAVMTEVQFTRVPVPGPYQNFIENVTTTTAL